MEKKSLLCCLVFAALLLRPEIYAQKTGSTPVITSTPVIAFKANATFVGGEPIANNTAHKVDFGDTLFNEGNCFSKDKDEFAAPEDGYYHFDLRVSWLKFSVIGTVELYILTNWYAAVPAGTIQQPSTTLSVFDSNFSALLKLKKGDKITVELRQTSGAQ